MIGVGIFAVIFGAILLITAKNMKDKFNKIALGCIGGISIVMGSLCFWL